MYVIYYSTAWGHQRTVGIPAGGGRADTPAGGGQASIPAGAAHGWAHMLTLWGKEDTGEEAVPWELGNIKFQVGRERERSREK